MLSQSFFFIYFFDLVTLLSKWFFYFFRNEENSEKYTNLKSGRPNSLIIIENSNRLNWTKITQAVSSHQLAHSTDICRLLLYIHLPNPPGFQMGHLLALLMISFTLFPTPSPQHFLKKKKKNYIVRIVSWCVNLNATLSGEHTKKYVRECFLLVMTPTMSQVEVI